MINIEETVPEYLDGQRSDIIASELFPDFSRSRLQSWIKDGSLLVDGSQVRPKDKLLVNQCLSLNAEYEQQERWEPQNIPLNLVYEDEHLLVVDKPVGLVVHPAAGNPDGTLLNALLHHVPETGSVQYQEQESFIASIKTPAGFWLLQKLSNLSLSWYVNYKRGRLSANICV